MNVKGILLKIEFIKVMKIKNRQFTAGLLYK